MKHIIKTFFFSLFLLIYFFCSSNLHAQYSYKFWVEFTDKKNSNYSTANPSAFLSERAIKRRLKQNIVIDESDLPVNKAYLDQIENNGIEVLHTSKWLNAAVIGTNDSSKVNLLSSLPFIENIELAAVYQQLKKANDKFLIEQGHHSIEAISTNEYGYAYNQINLHNGDWLHNQGYKGDGVHIAIIDAGFLNADILSAFDSLWMKNRILGFKDFVDPTNDLFRVYSHGTQVLSIIGTNVPGMYVGTAPQASFWLLRSEDGSSEMRIEEMNWIAAAEFADSAGVDVINTSLGYSVFDIATQNYTYEDMTGKISYVSRGAEMAASKGMLLIVSAGNEGNALWKYITAPADADNIITTGAINVAGFIAPFSSLGPSFDGRVKPDVVSAGWSTALVNTNGNYEASNGTSFSAPMITGLVSCLWQAFPDTKNTDIIDAVKFSSDKYNNPDDSFGYGIPNFKSAFERLMDYHVEPKSFSVHLTTTSWGNYIEVKIVNPDDSPVVFEIFDINGRKIRTDKIAAENHTINYPLDFLKNYSLGIYFVNVKHFEGSKTIKAIR